MKIVVKDKKSEEKVYTYQEMSIRPGLYGLVGNPCCHFSVDSNGEVICLFKNSIVAAIPCAWKNNRFVEYYGELVISN